MQHLKLVLVGVAVVFAAATGLWFYNQSAPNTSTQTLSLPEVASSHDDEAALDDSKNTSAPVLVERTEQPASIEPPQTATPIQPVEEKVKLPELNSSDAAFIDIAQKLSPNIVAWLLPEQQIRKWVAFVDNIAVSKVPSLDRPLVYPIGDFIVDEVLDSPEEQQYFSTVNYARADILIDTLTNTPAQQLVRSYQQWLPVFEQAYAELGYDHSFNECLQAALENILAVEAIDQPTALVQPSALYKYQDPHLEHSDALSKLLWRIGPDNAEKLQRYANQIQYLISQ